MGGRYVPEPDDRAGGVGGEPEGDLLVQALRFEDDAVVRLRSQVGARSDDQDRVKIMDVPEGLAHRLPVLINAAFERADVGHREHEESLGPGA